MWCAMLCSITESVKMRTLSKGETSSLPPVTSQAVSHGTMGHRGVMVSWGIGV